MKAKDLKNSILQMAVEGKLVPQDPNDEPASVLLDRIRKEKQRLIAEGKAKFPKDGESIIYAGSDGSPYEKRVDAKGRVLSEKHIADEVPFEELPEGWVWARLNTVFAMQAGKNIKATLLADEQTDKTPYPCFGGNGIRGFVSKPNADGDYPIIGRQGALCGNIKRASGQFYATEHAVVVTCFSDTYIPWACCFLEALNLNQYATATAQPGLAVSKISNALIPLPPLVEQHRIVDHVNELMSLVEEYGELENAREALDAALPDRLRKSVLQMAVQGKLVPQDPADEPASVLLERIREQRRKLIAEKKIKAPKGSEPVIYTGSDGRRYEKRVDAKGRESEPVCIEDEIPFEIPDGWKWARLESVIILLSGTDLKPSQYNDKKEGIPYLTGASNFADGKLIENRWTIEPTRISNKGELLFTCKGTVGEMAVNQFDAAHIARQIMSVTPCEYEMLPYITLFLKAMVEDIKSYAKGVIPGIERNTLLARLIPVPPLTEQNRIVEKSAELFNKIA